MKRKLMSALLAGVMLAGCSGGSTVASTQDGGKTTVEFWYA